MAKFAYAKPSYKIDKKDLFATKQIKKFLNLGVPRKNIFIEVRSCHLDDRTIYQSLIKRLKPGDILFVTGLEKCARSIAYGVRSVRNFEKNQIKFVDLSLEKILEEKNGDMATKLGSYYAQKDVKMRRDERIDRIARDKKKSQPLFDYTIPSKALLQEIVDLQVSGFDSGQIMNILWISPKVFLECLYNFSVVD